MKSRSFFSILITGVVLLLTLSAGGAYWLTTHTPLNLLRGGPTTPPAAAIFVSKQAPALFSLLVNPDRLESLRQVFASPEERRQSQAEFDRIKKSLLANTGLDYGRDIQPWLGDEITVAVTGTDFDRDTSNGQQLGLLLAVAATESERGREFLELFWQKQAVAGEAFVSEPYKGVNLTYRQATVDNKPALPPSLTLPRLTPNLPPTLATAAIGGEVAGSRRSFVLFANHPKVLRDAINNVQAANLNLNSAPAYQRVLQQLTAGRIGFAFANVPQLHQWLVGSELANPETLASALAVTFGIHPQGLLAETALVMSDAEKSVSPTLSSPVGALKYVPAGSSFVATSVNLNQLWTEGVAGSPPLSQLMAQVVSDFKASSGVDLPTDIFSWVQGEYALALLPTATKTGDWIFVAESSPASQSAVERLDAIAQSQGYSLGSFPLGGDSSDQGEPHQKITAWTRLTTSTKNDKETTLIEAKAKGVRATVGRYEILATSVEAMDEALKTSEKGTILDNAEFQTGLTPLPPLNEGYLYLDWSRSRPVWERQIPLLRLVELSARPFFDHFRSLTLSGTGEKAGVRRASIFIRFS